MSTLAAKLTELTTSVRVNGDSVVTEVLGSVTFLEQADSYEVVVVA